MADKIYHYWSSVVLALLILSFFGVSGFVNASTQDFDESLAKSKTYLDQGQYIQAQNTLEQALNAAGSDEQRALAIGTLGFAHYQLHHDSDAEKLLKEALIKGKENRRERARWSAQLASLMMTQGRFDEAKRFYINALAFAENGEALKIGIELQQAEMLPRNEYLPKLNDLLRRLLLVKPGEDRAKYLVRLATLAHQFGQEGRKLAYESLLATNTTKSPRLLAEIIGATAQLYEDDHRYDEAFQLNQNAIDTVKTTESPDLLLELEWRKGRLYRNRKQIPEAIAAFQRAIEHVETIRHDIPLTYRNGQSSFRTTLEPLYQQLADLLLEQANHQNGMEKMPLLRRARSVIELIKQAELEDYLGGRCAIQPKRSTLLEAVESKTAIIYPIILPDRLELLVSTGNDIQQFTQSINAKNLREAARKFIGALRSGQPDFNSISTSLYQWLIAPLEGFLYQRNIQTLVIVPDGILRLIPFAALYDGENYLIERYAISTSPGLSIIEPSPLQPQAVKSLIVGLSEPGNVIDHLPDAILNEFKGTNSRGVSLNNQTRSRALIMPDDSEASTTKPTFEKQPKRSDERFRQQLIEAFRLPGVITEVESLKSTLPGTVLLDGAFTVDRFRQELINERYSVVHIASHLIAGSNAASSFIMAHDNIINFDEIDGLLRSGKFANQPVEMLTLSACQTAEGDDRAPLGLSGLAIKAKVRSALGTLWPVSDEAAPLLMVEFYKALNQAGTSKTQALQHAQKTLLANKKLAHPFFWAPYILIGNWL